MRRSGASRCGRRARVICAAANGTSSSDSKRRRGRKKILSARNPTSSTSLCPFFPRGRTATGASRPGAPIMKILHLEDNAEDAELVRELILEEWPDSTIRCVASRFAFVGELHCAQYDLILSDF